MRPRGLLIAIDGPAGAGKTTAARHLARRLGYLYLDTGATFRAVALKAMRDGVDLADPSVLGEESDVLARVARESEIQFAGAECERLLLGGEDVSNAIRTPEVSQASSRIAAQPGLREVLTRLWREMAREGGVVLEGRDIGTVVFPDADVKFYLVARPEIRAERRFRELVGREPVSLQTVAADLSRRDQADSSRRHAPLARAADAIEVDTSDLTVEQTAELLERRVLATIDSLGRAEEDPP